MAVKYDRSGIRFMYPETWDVADETREGQTRSVVVQAPGGAFWSVDLCPRAVDSQAAAAQVLRAMQQDYDDLEAEPVTDWIGGREATGYDMQFCCMDFIIAAHVRAIGTQLGTLVFLCQGEDREFQRLEPVFRAMSESMFRDDV
jgi:hypothetical protein